MGVVWLDRCWVKYSESVKFVRRKWKRNWKKREIWGNSPEIWDCYKGLRKRNLKIPKSLNDTAWLESPENCH